MVFSGIILDSCNTQGGGGGLWVVFKLACSCQFNVCLISSKPDQGLSTKSQPHTSVEEPDLQLSRYSHSWLTCLQNTGRQVGSDLLPLSLPLTGHGLAGLPGHQSRHPEVLIHWRLSHLPIKHLPYLY